MGSRRHLSSDAVKKSSNSHKKALNETMIMILRDLVLEIDKIKKWKRNVNLREKRWKEAKGSKTRLG